MVPLLTTTSTVMCPHGGQARLATSHNEAAVDGAPALLQTDVHAITGCPFTLPSGPMPCLSIRWVSASTQARLHGVPLLLQSSVGLCLNAAQAPQGTALVVQVQSRALAS